MKKHESVCLFSEPILSWLILNADLKAKLCINNCQLNKDLWSPVISELVGGTHPPMHPDTLLFIHVKPCLQPQAQQLLANSTKLNMIPKLLTCLRMLTTRTDKRGLRCLFQGERLWKKKSCCRGYGTEASVLIVSHLRKSTGAS